MNENTYKKHLSTVIKLMRARYNRDIVDYNFIDGNNVELKDHNGARKALITERMLTNLWNDAEEGKHE